MRLLLLVSWSQTWTTDLAAVPAKAVGEIRSGGALLVHQQQTGEHPLELQGDHPDLREMKTVLVRLPKIVMHMQLQGLTFASGLSLSSRHPNSSGPRRNSSSAYEIDKL